MTITAFTTTKSLTVLRGASALARLGARLDRLGVTRAFVLTGTSIATRTPLLNDLTAALGPRHAGSFAGIGAHTPMPALIDSVARARAAGADAILSLGGGSVIDAGKIACACLAWNVRTRDDLRARIAARDRGPIPGLPVHVCLPTTASAAEFTTGAGVHDAERQQKTGLNNPALVPELVVLDPALVLHTPPGLWLSSAIRSVDHAVEALGGDAATPYTDALAEKALTLLFDALPRCHADPEDLEAIADVQSATWLAGTGCTGAHTGLSHGIGYLFGAHFGVAHGHCSCITLPHVMDWNGAAGHKADRVLRHLTGRAGAEAVDALIRGLGLPRRLSEVSDRTPEDLAALAPLVMELRHVSQNPRRLESEAEARDLLARMY